MITNIHEPGVEAVAKAFVDNRRDANSAGFRKRFESGGNVYAVPVDVVSLDDDIAQVDADAQPDRGVADGQGLLDRECGFHRIND
jgi:hypothetical protein